MFIKSVIRNLLAGITTSLAMVPEVVAFALLAHVNPLVGLYAAFIVGFVSAAFGGRPGLISGGAGSLAVVSVALVTSHGVEYLFACVALMGIFQILFGVLKLGRYIKLISSRVMQGFVNGLAIVIFLSQLQSVSFQNADFGSSILLIGLTIFCVWWSPVKNIPPALFGLFPATILVYFGFVDSRVVADISQISGGLPEFHIPSVPLTLDTLGIIFPYSLILCGVGLIETLLTARMVDERIDGKSENDREAVAQGFGNLITGFFGGMGGCAMIGQTVVNLNSGGRQRLSGMVQATCVLLYIVLIPSVIESIPIAGLVGLMVVVCFHTFDWKSFVDWKHDKRGVFVMIVVTAITVLVNLAFAVLVGVLISALMHYWDSVK